MGKSVEKKLQKLYKDYDDGKMSLIAAIMKREKICGGKKTSLNLVTNNINGVQSPNGILKIGDVVLDK